MGIEQVILGDCLEKMKDIPDKSIDMILTDPPYGTIACKWDSIIPFEPMWKEINRIIKDNAAIVLFGSQPFTSLLISSNLKMFKYEWIYKKRCGSNFANAKNQPIKDHENVLVFGNKKTNYFPIKEERKGSGLSRVKYSVKNYSQDKKDYFLGNFNSSKELFQENKRYPSSVQEFNNRSKGNRGLHPTQKPVELLEYLIKTYTQENDLVLDFTCGSGSTLVAAKNLNRQFIGIEKEKEYYEITLSRLYP